MSYLVICCEYEPAVTVKVTIPFGYTLSRSEDKPKDDNKPQEQPFSINKDDKWRSYKRRAFRSLKKSQQKQVKNVHMMPPSKHRKREAMDMVLSEEDAKRVK